MLNQPFNKHGIPLILHLIGSVCTRILTCNHYSGISFFFHFYSLFHFNFALDFDAFSVLSLCSMLSTFTCCYGASYGRRHLEFATMPSSGGRTNHT